MRHPVYFSLRVTGHSIRACNVYTHHAMTIDPQTQCLAWWMTNIEMTDYRSDEVGNERSFLYLKYNPLSVGGFLEVSSRLAKYFCFISMFFVIMLSQQHSLVSLYQERCTPLHYQWFVYVRPCHACDEAFASLRSLHGRLTCLGSRYWQLHIPLEELISSHVHHVQKESYSTCSMALPIDRTDNAEDSLFPISNHTGASISHGLVTHNWRAR